MSEKSPREVLDEWRALLDSAIASAASVAGRSELPREILRAMQHQAELLQELLEREQGLQRSLAATLLTPLDALFDLLEESGATVRRQAEALESAGRALQDAAGLMRGQAEILERALGTLRQPADLARSAAGLGRRARRGPAAGSGKSAKSKGGPGGPPGSPKGT
jgi:hypothetical protein